MKKNIYAILYGLLLIFAVGMPTHVYTQDDNFSEEERLELEELEREIEAMISQMSPEEQEEIARIAQEIDEMSPEELEDYLDALLEEEEMSSGGEEQPEQPSNEKTPEPVALRLPSNKERAAEKLIESIIHHIDSCMVKLNAMLDIGQRMERWAQQGKITQWPSDKTWFEVKSDIELLQSRLRMALDTLPNTAHFKYLVHIADNENIMHHLEKLAATLATYEPQIAESLFGIEELKDSSKVPLQKTMSELMDALYDMALPTTLLDLMAKFDPEAEKLKKEVDQAAKKAAQEQGKVKRPGASVTAGKPSSSSFKSAGSFKYPSFGGQSTSPSSRSDSGPEIERAPASKVKDKGGTSGDKSDKGKAPSSKGGKKKSKKATKKAPKLKRRVSKKKPKKSTPAKSTSKKMPTKSGAASAVKEPVVERPAVEKQTIEKSTIEKSAVERPAEANQQLEDILVKLEQLLRSVYSIAISQEFDQLFFDIQKSDITEQDMTLSQVLLPEIMRVLGPRNGLLDQLRTFERVILSATADQKAYYYDQLSFLFKRYNRVFNVLIDDFNVLVEQQATLPYNKQYLYFGAPAVYEGQTVEQKATIDTIARQVLSPTSVHELIKMMNDIQALFTQILSA